MSFSNGLGYSGAFAAAPIAFGAIDNNFGSGFGDFGLNSGLDFGYGLESGLDFGHDAGFGYGGNLGFSGAAFGASIGLGSF